MEVQLPLFPVDCCMFPPPCAVLYVSVALMSPKGSNPFPLNHSGKKSVAMTRP